MSLASNSDALCSPRSIAEYRVVLMPARRAMSCWRMPAAMRRSFQLSDCVMRVEFTFQRVPLRLRYAGGMKRGNFWNVSVCRMCAS
jgi:hypothetical protein